LKVKSRKYKFLPDIATADIAYEAFGKNYNELFENAGLALESVMVNLETVKSSRVKKIKLQADSLENLLFTFLQELVFLKDAEQLLFNRIKCDVREVNSGQWTANSELSGEEINPQKHKLGVDVKAVTKHLFKVEKFPKRAFHCQVILDV